MTHSEFKRGFALEFFFQFLDLSNFLRHRFRFIGEKDVNVTKSRGDVLSSGRTARQEDGWVGI